MTTTVTEGITKDQIKVLQTFDTFYIHTEDGRKAILNCRKEEKLGEVRYEFELPCHILGYKIDGRRAASSHLSNYHFFSSHLSSVAHILKPGDMVTLNWEVSDGNDHTKNAGFEWYTLEVNIKRGKTELVFTLEHNVYPRSTWGMVR